MRKIFTTLTLCLFAVSVFAQTIPNGGFETWINQGSYSEPENWRTNNDIQQFAGEAPVLESGDSYSGSSAVKLKTVEFQGSMIPGNLETTFAFTDKPKFLRGYYKGTFQNSDSAIINVSLISYAGSNPEPIGVGVMKLTNAGSYTVFQIEIDYASQQSPDSAYIIITNSVKGTAEDNETYIDGLEFTNQSASLQEQPTVNFSIEGIYPNPAHDKANIQFNTRKPGNVNIAIYDLLGNKVSQPLSEYFATGNHQMRMDVSEYKPGIYFYTFMMNGEQTTGRFVVK